MTTPSRQQRAKTPPPIYVVSGGAGASGEQLVQTALAQFPDNNEQCYARLDVSIPIDYINSRWIGEEVQTALRVFQRGRFAVIDVTDKPIETSANEIIKLIESRAKS